MKYLIHIISYFLFSFNIAQAHPVWILPNEFSISSDKPEWVTIDVTASNVLFNFDHSIGLEPVHIYSPDGKKQPVSSYFKGHHRSVFDLQLSQNGTYKVELKRPPFFFTSYKVPGKNSPQRLMANKTQATKQLPADAQEVKTLLIHLSSATYITNNQPSEQVFKPTGEGLELQPLTHPNDIVRGEEAEWKLLLDGQAAANLTVELTPGGTHYRNDRNTLRIPTDSEGKFSFTPEQASPWLLFTSVNQPTDNPQADGKYLMLYMTFEVMLD